MVREVEITGHAALATGHMPVGKDGTFMAATMRLVSMELPGRVWARSRSLVDTAR